MWCEFAMCDCKMWSVQGRWLKRLGWVGVFCPYQKRFIACKRVCACVCVQLCLLAVCGMCVQVSTCACVCMRVCARMCVWLCVCDCVFVCARLFVACMLNSCCIMTFCGSLCCVCMQNQQFDINIDDPSCVRCWNDRVQCDGMKSTRTACRTCLDAWKENDDMSQKYKSCLSYCGQVRTRICFVCLSLLLCVCVCVCVCEWWVF